MSIEQLQKDLAGKLKKAGSDRLSDTLALVSRFSKKPAVLRSRDKKSWKLSADDSLRQSS